MIQVEDSQHHWKHNPVFFCGWCKKKCPTKNSCCVILRARVKGLSHPVSHLLNHDVSNWLYLQNISEKWAVISHNWKCYVVLKCKLKIHSPDNWYLLLNCHSKFLNLFRSLGSPAFSEHSYKPKLESVGKDTFTIKRF